MVLSSVLKLLHNRVCDVFAHEVRTLSQLSPAAHSITDHEHLLVGGNAVSILAPCLELFKLGMILRSSQEVGCFLICLIGLLIAVGEIAEGSEP